MAAEEKRPQAPKVAIASAPEPAAEEPAAVTTQAPAASAPAQAAAAPEPASAPAPEPAAPAAAPAAEEQRSVADNIEHMRSATRGFLSSVAPGHEHAVLGGLLGLLVACLVFWIGIPRTLVLCLFAVAGVAVGQALDGDPKIVKAIVRLVNHGER